MLHKVKLFLNSDKHVRYSLFILFSILLFIKCILFHWDAFHSILISSLWRDPLSFYKFYMAKLLMPLFISSFIFISKRYWWTIIISLFIDIWCIANLIYFKTYDAFLSVYDMLLVGNMSGAWSSVAAYFDWYMLAILALTILWGGLCAIVTKTEHKRRWGAFFVSLLIVFVLAYINNHLVYNLRFWPGKSKEEAAQLSREHNEWISFVNEHGGNEMPNDALKTYMPFYHIYIEANNTTAIKSNFMEQYIRLQSIISDFIAVNVYFLFHKNVNGEIIPLQNDEIELVKPFFNTNANCEIPNNHLIVILIESLEDWPLHNSIEGQEVAPSLKKLKHQEHTLYCGKIKSQTLGGNSGDGQMIINTGLLPISNGVACMHYGNNEYPNFAHFYSNSILINPWPQIWNQDTMSVRYSYTKKIEPEYGQWEDAKVMEIALKNLQEVDAPTCIFAITVSTHSPFNRVRNNQITTTAPPLLNRYMQCLNYTDSCIGAFMDYILNDPKLSQSTIVITSDHTIFKPAMLPDFMDYATKQNLSIASGENYCPLIIYSPKIKGNIQVDELCYQMDVFPTILHLIGCEDYYWKSFGVNLLDSVARNNRPITEQEAYLLSDKLIRANYFSLLTQ